MKIPHPANFKFAQSAPAHTVQAFADNVFRLKIQTQQASANEPAPFFTSLSTTSANDSTSANGWSVEFDASGSLQIKDSQGLCWLRGNAEGCFGTAGEAWMLRFEYAKEMRFFGLGEKAGSLEKTSVRTYFWNVDVWGEHALSDVRTGAPDPQYVSIPWLIVECRVGEQMHAIGLLVHHPGNVFFSLEPDMRLHSSQDSVPGGAFYVGAQTGIPELWILVSDNVESLCTKLSRLVGTMPVPPVWALGNHQCRWGYRGSKDLLELDAGFREHHIPCDGLWLDIDYMDGFRVFTTSPEHFAKPAEVMQALRAKGRRVLAILDPGVKDEVGYAVRDDLVAQDLACHNEVGDYYRGFVWPGATLFPDFSLPAARDWWANQVAHLAALGFAGFWLDMNDPSTGSVPEQGMLFDKGRKAHSAYHNWYANGMAEATRKGLLLARPSEQPFLLTRSASTGIARFSAVWMGDSFSNWHHLQQSIPMALNMSMSGVPMVGADIGGFGDDTNAELMERWVQAHCLFPFFRNHSVKDSIRQEPWRFGAETTAILRKFIQFRYQMIPYLKSLFEEHERSGALVLRPYFMEDTSCDAYEIEDQFFVGQHLMVAPILSAGLYSRKVKMPPGQWHQGFTGSLLQGPAVFELECKRDELLFFVRDGAQIPRLRKAPQVSTDEIDWNDLV